MYAKQPYRYRVQHLGKEMVVDRKPGYPGVVWREAICQAVDYARVKTEVELDLFIRGLIRRDVCTLCGQERINEYKREEQEQSGRDVPDQ